jgi:hypothetical protein
MAIMLAVGLMLVAGLSSTVMAHGDKNPGNHPKPTKVAKVQPKTHKLPDCKLTPVVTPTPTAAPTATPVALDDEPGAVANMAKLASKTSKTQSGTWSQLKSKAQKVACSIEGIRTAAEKRADNYVRSLTRLLTTVNKSTALTAGQKAQLAGELSGLIAKINAIKAKIHAETTLEGLQADLVQLNAAFKSYRPVVKQVNLVMAAAKVAVSGTKFDTLVAQLEAYIAAAPDGTAKTQAQALLVDLKAKVAEAEALAAPIPAALLAYTPDQLIAGAGAQALKDASTAMHKVSTDLHAASKDAKSIVKLLGVKVPPKSPKPVPTPTTAPTI